MLWCDISLRALTFLFRFQLLKRKHEAKLRNGTEDEEGEIIFLAAKEKEEARLSRIEADRLLRNRAVAA